MSQKLTAGEVELVALQTALDTAVESYLSEYELCGDDGYYTPLKQERLLIADAAWGLIEDDDFKRTFLARHSIAQSSLIETQAAELAALRKALSTADDDLRAIHAQPMDTRLSDIYGEHLMPAMQRTRAALAPSRAALKEKGE